MKRGSFRRFSFRLAKELGVENATAMRRRMPAKLFVEWTAYEELEPFGEERADLRVALLLQLLTNIYRDRKRWPSEFQLGQFMPHVGDSGPPPPKRTQTVKQTFDVLKAIAMAYAKQKPKPGREAK